mgnify:CR=1 FL=1
MMPCADCGARSRVTESRAATHSSCSRKLHKLSKRLGIDAIERKRACTACGWPSRTIEISVSDLRLMLEHADLTLDGLPPEM